MDNCTFEKKIDILKTMLDDLDCGGYTTVEKEILIEKFPKFYGDETDLIPKDLKKRWLEYQLTAGCIF